MSTFQVRVDGKGRYYDSAMEAILRYAEAKDKCKSMASVWFGDKLLVYYDAPETIRKLRDMGVEDLGGTLSSEEFLIPQSEWFYL